MEGLGDEVRGKQLVLLSSSIRLLQLRRGLSLSLLRAQVHLPKLLAERIGVLGWRLSVRRGWLCAVRSNWSSVAWRRRSIARRCGRAVSWDSGRWWWCSSLTARVGSELVRRARIALLSLAVRHDGGSGSRWEIKEKLRRMVAQVVGGCW